MSEIDASAATGGAPHRCMCAAVSRCGIYVHPSPEVQTALNALVDALTTFDQDTGSRSVVAVRSRHRRGVFTSITRRHAGDTTPTPPAGGAG